MSDAKDPILFGTEKDYAWAAWQKAFDAGTLLPDRERFERYFNEVYLKLGFWPLRERLMSAWNSGVVDRNEQGTAGFNAWWQEIVDSQPKPGGAP